MRPSRVSVLLAALPALALATTPLAVGDFARGDLSGWEKKVFQGETVYTFVEVDGRRALRAQSAGTASGLYKKVRIDLTETPTLRWSWRVDNVLTGVDETTKAGDDYPARIYVVVSGGLFFWNTRALNYVWSSAQPAGRHWPNAFTANATMLAVESGAQHLGRWIEVKRDLRADLKRYLGRDVRTIDAVALMTDTDNTGQSAVAYYGDIEFTRD